MAPCAAPEARMRVAGGKRQRTHRMERQTRPRSGGAHEPAPTHAPRRGADHFRALTGGCGASVGRAFPPATFCHPSGMCVRLPEARGVR